MKRLLLYPLLVICFILGSAIFALYFLIPLPKDFQIGWTRVYLHGFSDFSVGIWKDQIHLGKRVVFWRITPLRERVMVSIFEGKQDVAERILRRTPSINLPENETDETLLDWAIGLDKAEVVEMLLKNGATEVIDRQWAGEQTPLHRAVWDNRLEIARLLLEYGADPTLEDEDGDTPLDMAIMDENEKMMDLFKNYLKDDP